MMRALQLEHPRIPAAAHHDALTGSSCSAARWSPRPRRALSDARAVAGVFGHTDAELKQQVTHTGHNWDFATMWKIAEGVSYAELQ